MSLAHANTQSSRMTVDAFVDWASNQASGRYELVDGEIVTMPAEGGRHNLAKLEIAIALRDAVKAAGLECTVFTDGMTVRIDAYQGREPDAAVTLGKVADLGAKILADPVIVVEVISPGSEVTDTATKLLEYFSVPSIRHYLIVSPEPKAVIHHLRAGDGTVTTRIVHGGDLSLDPPGMVLAVDPILAVL
jgi:Uma2 family endonuclease